MLDQNERDNLAKVVSEVEKSTSGELRLIIVERSTSFGHVNIISALLCMFLAQLILWILRFELILDSSWYCQPLTMIASGLCGWWLGRFSLIRRYLTHPKDVMEQVWGRAELEFHREGLNKTKEKTGILIFLSRAERQAVVLADQGIASKVKADIWNDVVACVVEGAKTGNLKAKLEEAIHLCGKVLSQHFPPSLDNKNELSDHIIVKK